MKLKVSLKHLAATVILSISLPFISKAEVVEWRPLAFSWGAEIGSNVDMSHHDLSSIGINARLGLQWKWIRFFGVGAEGDFMVSNSNRSYPIFANFRTDFSNNKRLVFVDLRGGITLNYFETGKNTGAYASAGLGVTLAKGKSFSSHVILAYTYVGQDVCKYGDYLRTCPGVSMATVRLGITFNTGKGKKTVYKETSPVTPVKKTTDSGASSRDKQKNFKIEAPVPPFIDRKANKISLPTADRERWAKLASDIENARRNGEQINIVHIGDSHIQAEMATSRLREILQEQYGNGGRGLITAFRLAGTNQPVDYEIVSEFPTDSQVRLLKRPWPLEPGFTGVASLSNRSNKITFRNLGKGHDFNRARIYTSNGVRKLAYENPVDSDSFYALPGERVYGIYTANSHKPGIIYSTIGNNGACFSDYLLLDGFGKDVSSLQPRLIILSMGTNEGFSDMTTAEIAKSTRKLITDLKATNPDALFMIWAPMECHYKDDKGDFVVKDKVKTAWNSIRRVAELENIPVWDFYDVAGGDGCAQKWVDEGLMNPKDHVHLLKKGYVLQGELAAEALIDFINRLSRQ